MFYRPNIILRDLKCCLTFLGCQFSQSLTSHPVGNYIPYQKWIVKYSRQVLKHVHLSLCMCAFWQSSFTLEFYGIWYFLIHKINWPYKVNLFWFMHFYESHFHVLIEFHLFLWVGFWMGIVNFVLVPTFFNSIYLMYHLFH